MKQYSDMPIRCRLLCKRAAFLLKIEGHPPWLDKGITVQYIILFKVVGIPPTPRKVRRQKKAELPGDVLAAKVRKKFQTAKKVEFLNNFLLRKGE